MAIVQQRYAARELRASAQVVANAILLVATFLGLSGSTAAGLMLAAVALAIFATVAVLPARPLRGR